MLRVFSDFGKAKTASAVSAGATTLDVDNASGFWGSWGEGERQDIRIGDFNAEIIGISGNTLTVASALPDIPSGADVHANLMAKHAEGFWGRYRGILEKTVDFTISQDYDGVLVLVNGAANVTVPASFPELSRVDLLAMQVFTLAAGAGAVLYVNGQLQPEKQYSLVSLLHLGGGEWIVSGEVKL